MNHLYGNPSDIFLRKGASRRKLLSIAALSLGLVVSTAANENPFWEQFGKRAVSIQQGSGPGAQTLKFLDYKDGMLIAELEGGAGEISVPVSETMVGNLRLATPELPRARERLSQGDFLGALHILRPMAYPFVKFHQLPASFTQLHVPVQEMLNALIRAGELDEARDLINRIELDKVTADYNSNAIQLMNAYLAASNYDPAIEIAMQLPVEGGHSSNIRPLLDATHALRDAGKFDAVIPLYRTIEAAVSGEARENIRMWLAYSFVLANRLDEAAPIMNALKEPHPSHRLFSLYQLLQGSREYKNQNYTEALDILTRGFVRAQTNYAWVPEMLFMIGDCYARADDTTAARNVWTEIAVLYPTSQWGRRANESLEKLPPPPAAEATPEI